MTLKHDPIDKRYILNCLNYSRTGHKKGKHDPKQVFLWFKNSRGSEYFEFGLAQKIGGEIRPSHAVLNGKMIEDIEKKYEFCSVNSYDGKGLSIICRRNRWNECFYCTRILWKTRKNGGIQRFCSMKIHNGESLCPRCYKQVKKIE